MNTWWTWTALIAIGGLGGAGDIWVYEWARSGRTPWLAASCLAHGASVILFGLLLRWDGRAFCAAFMLSSVVHVALVVSADALFLGGRLTAAQWVGMALAAAAIVLLEASRPDEPGVPDPPHPVASVLEPRGARR